MRIPRVHLFEWHEKSWFPDLIRDQVTLLLMAVWRFDPPLPSILKPLYTAPYAAIFPTLVKTLELLRATTVCDLCSGGGGPTIKLARSMEKKLDIDVNFILTDLYPNFSVIEHVNKKENNVMYCLHPVDALSLTRETLNQITSSPTQWGAGLRPVLPNENVLYTCFGSFHHFRPELAEEMLRNLLTSIRFEEDEESETYNGILIAEMSFRNWRSILGVVFLLPLFILLASTTVLFPHMTTIRFFYTFVLPVVPLTIVWDGVVSCLRTYTSEELLAMAKKATEQSSSIEFEWEYGEIQCLPFGLLGVNYFVGIPRKYVKPVKE
ncbi:hypothetical protein K493DRAFT_239703 [Basidiobolus meristosporus CBS 931.73]|uniref:S-adenosyl-L-methionine-dependent methyltransferase n=1 Tax=Basidiobolus meristosporus CBS 931.73 TaxID=1314790 RepID=A0A1Y1XDE5_9FUNG|nr:hypothetical protein K493DRAFT_239703 [Basidiobolus meristosporus CBS 931.73]|eukprot:ORX83759.1 hypothetical protein K493DRAFT_239703 [Basidiobolus meristosporus CBS 931.73]